MSLDLVPFSGLSARKPDALLALIALHEADRRPGKIDVGVGVYRDETDRTPVMRAVKAAEVRLADEQPTKAYLGADGDVQYTALLSDVVFGSHRQEPRRFGLQTPGGTGALRLGAELIAHAAPDTRVWLGAPTWPNHAPIFEEARLKTATHPYFDMASGGIAFDAMIDALGDAAPGDVLLLHGCCHNPTGTQFTLAQWRELANLCNVRGLVPFVDLAYQGLGDGLEEDAAGVRQLLEAVPGALLAYSCDKNFGLYRERVGALWVQASAPGLTELVRGNLLALARSLWSMPPDHGAAIVRTILEDSALVMQWRDELDAMRARINAVRKALAAQHPALDAIAGQRGLFSLLPVDADAVASMRDSHGIYMPANARLNLAGLNARNLVAFAEALRPHIPAVAARVVHGATSAEPFLNSKERKP
ncbi:amino acid aminotransferase [Novosphingobium album (ex Hu et al. 2023)]|uniref:Aspartate/tyrosine/aromatic aminotransferase n=1 Tax=Novosphingobium album (ex Hu et al. 2023) TaxID=2930093 RepID=A0ABT0B7F1_9SPHN|nr:amino acid aminotransferase [Novosphingobium album (ex Hu et al. 2023)]MCJ2180964.1 aspartate/tyrosine/aromatic aminotransferase [Novosphingobium album (ex Hu et al. 2023)]